MNRQLLYLSGRAEPAYQLRYSWTGWPSNEQFPELPSILFDDLSPLWEKDGLRLLEHRECGGSVQLLFSARPHVAPSFLAARAKGRLDHLLRQRNSPIKFSRKVAVRAVGQNSNRDVANYIQHQVDKEHFVDERFAATIRPFTQAFDVVDSSKPIELTRARYWYHLHIVLVHTERFRMSAEEQFRQIYDRSRQIAAKKGYSLTAISVMPDHLHLGVIGTADKSPEEIVLSFQNNLAFACGQVPIWRESYYVGTSGEYNMNALRAGLSDQP